MSSEEEWYTRKFYSIKLNAIKSNQIAIVITCNTFHQCPQLTARTLKATAMVEISNNGEQREIMVHKKALLD